MPHRSFNGAYRVSVPRGLFFLKLTPMVRLGMQIAFGRVCRKTAPTVFGCREGCFFLKQDLRKLRKKARYFTKSVVISVIYPPKSPLSGGL